MKFKRTDKTDAYLHSIKIMFSHLGVNSTKEEKALIKGIENEILKVIDFPYRDKDQDKSHFYYDTERNKVPNFP